MVATNANKRLLKQVKTQEEETRQKRGKKIEGTRHLAKDASKVGWVMKKNARALYHCGCW
jgi:hypothetical protein